MVVFVYSRTGTVIRWNVFLVWFYRYVWIINLFSFVIFFEGLRWVIFGWRPFLLFFFSRDVDSLIGPDNFTLNFSLVSCSFFLTAFFFFSLNFRHTLLCLFWVMDFLYDIRPPLLGSEKNEYENTLLCESPSLGKFCKHNSITKTYNKMITIKNPYGIFHIVNRNLNK